MKNVLIISYYFYPQNTPRAFRAYELTKEFLRRGYNVDLIIPNNNCVCDKEFKNDNLRILKVGKLKKEKQNISYKNSSNKFNSKVLSMVKTYGRKIYYYWFIDEFKNFNIRNFDGINKLYTNYDFMLSIGLPFRVHIFSSFISQYFNIRTKIADFGDPFYDNKFQKKAIYYKYLDKKCMKSFDYITIPTEKSKFHYKHIDNFEEKIKVIPQGFNFDDIKIKKYEKNSIVSFAYAGIFYKNGRNPEVFLDYVSNLKCNYKLYIYTDLNDSYVRLLINKYKSNNRIIFNRMIDRIDCIRELSSMDFLINIENMNTGQVPSKLIDYTLTNRPIYSFTEKNFSTMKMNEFLNGDYKNKCIIDINEYEINNILNKFEELI